MTTTLLQDIQGALQAQLVTLALGYPVAWEGTAYTPVIGTTFLATKDLPASSSAVSLGASGTVRYVGTFQVSVYVPIASGMGLANQIASEIEDGFRKQAFTQNAHSVQCGVPHAAPAIVGDVWIHKPVSIPYYLTN